MKEKPKQMVIVMVTLIVIGFLLWLGFQLILAVWHRFLALDPNLAVGLLTAASTVLIGTLTLALGRYFERKKEIEEHYREKKAEIYDSFLKEFFKAFYSPTEEKTGAVTKDDTNTALVAFLREWQRQMILQGGTNVLTAFLGWRAQLAKVDAQAMFKTDEFFRAIRKDIGLSNRGLKRGAFIRLLLKNPDVFFLMARENPNVTLAEVAKREKELGLEQ